MTDHTTPSAAPGIDLDNVHRYDHRGALMVPDATGDYYLVSEVRAALVRRTTEKAEPACIGCEGELSAENNPCAVCGRQAGTGDADERARFEAWLSAAFRKTYPHANEDSVQRRLWKHGDGDYMDLQTQHDWSVWQAAALSQQPKEGGGLGGFANLNAADCDPALAQQSAAKAEQIYSCIGKGGEYGLIGYSNGAGPKRGESIVVYYDTEQPNVLYHRSADDFRARMHWEGARAAPAQAAAKPDSPHGTCRRIEANLRDEIHKLHAKLDAAPMPAAASAEALTAKQITAGANVLGDDGKPIGRNTAIMVADAMGLLGVALVNDGSEPDWGAYAAAEASSEAATVASIDTPEFRALVERWVSAREYYEDSENENVRHFWSVLVAHIDSTRAAPAAGAEAEKDAALRTLADGYESGFFASCPQDGDGQFTLHYKTAAQAEAAYMAITAAIDRAAQAAPDEKGGE